MSLQRTPNTEHGCQTRSNDASRRLAARLQSISTLLAESFVGLEDTSTRARYAALLLYRLIFLHFIQHMGLFAGDFNYLQRRLAETQAPSLNFYRHVLLPLFTATGHAESLPVALTHLFTSHTIERAHPDLAIPNEVFASLFSLFEQCRWQTYELSRQDEDVITAEILGTLFAKDLRAKELGTYYTPEAITAYMARNTLLPALFTRVDARCTEISSPNARALFWQQLARQPARYLFAAARKGCKLPLPEEIAAGCQDIARRQRWQQAAPPAYALPGETWREVIARREYTDNIIARCTSESPDQLARLVTWNLDQQELALETLRACQQPEFLHAFYLSLRQLSVLDPTCGAGAFLCAALTQLEPLYLTCLMRMEELLAPYNDTTLAPELRHTFQEHLNEAGEAAQRRATVRQWIVEHNLYGVDLSEEAIEVCRLRFCLKILVARSDHSHAALPCNFGYHLCVGNSLLGPLHRQTSTGHSLLTALDTEPVFVRKTDTNGQCNLEKGHALNRQCACVGEINTDEHCSMGRGKNLDEQSAFVWDRAFPTIMARGGFDVVIGNPPYVKYELARQFYALDGYATLATGNLYALTIERGTDLLAPGGRCGMIVPSSATCTAGYRPLQKLLLDQQELHIASFSDQRGRLFDLAHPRLCMIFSAKALPTQTKPCRIFTTPYIKPGSETHTSLFEHLYYTEVTHALTPGVIPRYGSPLEQSIHDRLAHQSRTLGDSLAPTGPYSVYYTRKLSWFVQVTPFIPLILDAQGLARAPSELKTLRFASPAHAHIAFVALNSNLFYWLITTGSDCRNLNMREVLGLPLDLSSIPPELSRELCQLSQRLAEDLRAHASMQTMTFQGQGRLTIQCMHPTHSKHLIDEADRLLAHYYGFSEAELDFLLHYDEKYRRSDALKRERD